jgi:gliding motility-associated-like protein
MIRIYVSFLLCLLFFNATRAQQQSACPNLDFETGSLANWDGYTGTCCPISTLVSGFIPGRHTIMSGTGFDPHSVGDIPVVAPGGGSYSLRLGNDDINRQAESVKYTMTVTPNSNLFIYRYAVVLEDPSHSPPDQPRFEIRMYDANNQNIQCGMYNVVSSANIPGFLSNGDIRYKKWTTVGMDLSLYLGQTVTIEFRTGDCNLGGHFGYAYLDCQCGPLQIENAFCPNSPNVILSAPQGFASYLWSNGETTDSISVPSSNSGTIYSVTITSVTGCSATLSTTIASTSITAAFGTITNCQNDFRFTDLSSAFNGTLTNWLWDFGDGHTSGLQNPVYSFSTPGLHDVTLICESDKGCKDTVVNQVSVWPAPDSHFRVETVCEGLPTDFIDSSTIAWGNIVSTEWTFSDNTSSNVTSPVHQFPHAGNYSAQLITISDLGCVDTAVVNLTVYPIASIDAGPDTSFCGGAEINIGDVNNPMLNYMWSPASGITDFSSAYTSVHIPDPAFAVEDHLLYLTARDDISGCLSTDSILIQAKAIPVANFPTPVVECFNGNSFDFTASTNFPATTYSWNFGPQAYPPTSNNHYEPGVHYAQPGKYPLLLVTTYNGCVDSAMHEITVVEEPAIQMNINKTGCPPLQVDFYCSVSPPGPHTYSWGFSDNTTSNDSLPVHVFNDEGDFGVELTVTDSAGCTDYKKLSNVITVLPKPDSKFATEPNVASIVDPHFTFVNLSENGFMVSWDFGDNTYSADSNTSHIYPDTGLYLVRLIMNNTFGCTDTTVMPLRVEPYFTFYIPNAFTPNGDGVNDNFNGLGTYISDYEMRIYNRSGELIYHTNNYDMPWDGKGDLSNPSQNEVYEYLITVKDTKGVAHEYVGHVSVIR